MKLKILCQVVGSGLDGSYFVQYGIFKASIRPAPVAPNEWWWELIIIGGKYAINQGEAGNPTKAAEAIDQAAKIVLGQMSVLKECL